MAAAADIRCRAIWPYSQERVISRDGSGRLLAAVDRLSPAQRALVALLLTDPPMSYDQISAALAMPRGSVGPTRLRILRRLRTELAAVPGTAGGAGHSSGKA